MEARIKSYSKFLATKEVSESLRYHVSNNYSIVESIYRPGSVAHLGLLSEARELYFNGELELSGVDRQLFESTDLGKTGYWMGMEVPLDLPLEITELTESKSTKHPKLNYPTRGGSKKYVVYVKNPSTGRIKRIQFGDPGLNAKVSNPKARKSFAARHNCAKKKDRTMAGYWACRINRYAHLWGGKTYPGFW
jgi:hypothetical protein